MLKFKRSFSTLNSIQKIMKTQNPNDKEAQQEINNLTSEASQKEFENMFAQSILNENQYFQRYIINTSQFQKLYNSNSLSSSLRLAAGLNIGSLGLTADEESSKKLLELRKSQVDISQEDLLDIEFFENYFEKLRAAKNNDSERYTNLNALIEKQAKQGCLYAKFHIAQEFFEIYNVYYKKQNTYKYVKNQLNVNNIYFTREDINRIITYLLDFAAINPADSSFMIAELSTQISNDIVSKNDAIKFYMLAASHNEPNSCYQLSLQ